MPFDLTTELLARQQTGLYRRRKTVDSPQGPDMVVNGRLMLAFCSNDYLGLANHQQVVARFRQAADPLLSLPVPVQSFSEKNC